MSVSAPPPMTDFGAGMYAWLEPIHQAEEENGYPIGVLCGGVGEMFRDGEELVRARAGREPWQQALDVSACPDWNLDWLGQFVGVRALSGLTPDQKRLKIEAEAGFYRGGVDALRAAVAATLVSSTDAAPSVRINERTPDAWSIGVITDSAETPDTALTARVAAQATVAGLALTVSQRSVPAFDDGTLTFDAATGTFDSAGFPDVT